GHFPRATPRADSPSAPPNGTFPLTSYDWIFFETVAPRARDINESAISRYISGNGLINKEVLRCPSDNVEAHPLMPPGNAAEPYKYSYVMDSMIHSLTPGTDVRITKIKQPSDKILLLEEDERTINDGYWAPGVNGGTPDWL